LAPLGLAALAALVVPLLIHLRRRDARPPIAFAALRWLEPRPKPQRRPRLDERALLVARAALLTSLALALAQPVLRGAGGKGAWLAAAPGADPAAARATAPKATQMRWLAPGFPDLGRPAPAAAAPFSSLLRELDADLPPEATLTVVVPAALGGLDAERPRLSRPVQWRVTPGGAPTGAETHAATLPPPRLVLRWAPGLAVGARYLRAAAAAWSPTDAPDAGPSSRPLPAGAHAIAWLAPGPVPAAVRDRAAAGAILLLPAEASNVGLGPATTLWRDAEGLAVVEGGALGRGRWLRFTRPLDPESMPQLLAPDFPTRLAALLADPPPPPALVEARAFQPLVGARAQGVAAVDLAPVLALIAVALFALERALATRRQRAPSP
jgi:hypothetical protein